MSSTYGNASATSGSSGSRAALAGVKLREAAALHQQGQFAAARPIYEEVLSLHPNHPDALHYLGVMALQTSQPAAAVGLIGRAIVARPDQAAFHYHLGKAQQALQQWAAAVTAYDQAVSLQPDFADAHYNRGNALLALNQPAAAVAGYDRALAARPNFVEALGNRGSALRLLARLDDALASLDRAVALRPDYAEAWFNRAGVLHDQGCFELVVTSCDRVLALRPAHAAAHFLRGNALLALGHPDRALAGYEAALHFQPEQAETWGNRGAALHQLGQFEAAAESCRRAIALRPDYAIAHTNLGHALQRLGQWEAALASNDRALELNPDSAEARSNRGSVLQRLGRLEAAMTDYTRAITLKPDWVEPWANRASAHLDLRQLDEALADCDRAIALQSDHAGAHWNKALVQLLSGNFADGLPLYEWRWQADTGLRRRDFPTPLWRGFEPLQGKTLLVHSEQGLGDVIQFCRYVTLVAARGARVVFEVPRSLAGLLHGLAGVTQWVVRGQSLPAFDYHCPLLSLPLALQTTLENIPASPSYLRPDPEKVEKWAAILGKKVRPRAGLAWSGSAKNPNDRKRSLPLAQILGALPGDWDYCSLQGEVREADREVLRQHPEIRFWDDPREDFTDVAARCQHMDVVITVDTCFAHLSGALGRPTWVLLPFSPDWRWFLDRIDSPWYPSGKLYRQDRPGDWTTALARLKADLLRLAP